MGSLSCKCCGDKEDGEAKLDQDLKILGPMKDGKGSQAEALPADTGSDTEIQNLGSLPKALLVGIARKAVKHLISVKIYEESALKRLSAQAARVRAQLGPFLYAEGRAVLPQAAYLAAGSHYVGELSDQLPCGRGMLLSSDGSVSEGYWLSGALHGKGRQIFSNGEWYCGDWASGVMEGRGKMQYLDEHYYEGEWRKGLQQGSGAESWRDGAAFTGCYREGQKEGPGVFYWSDGSKYEGELRRNKLDGKGVYLWADGKKYEGDWRANRMHGSGKFSWPDGKTYSGHYQNDQKNGFGVFTWSDGRRYEGGWLNNLRHGSGVEYVQGIPVEGVWSGGKKVGVTSN